MCRALLEAIEDELQERQQSDVLAGDLDVLQRAEHAKCDAALQDAASPIALLGALASFSPAAPYTAAEQSRGTSKQHRESCFNAFGNKFKASEASVTDEAGCTDGHDIGCSVHSSCWVDVAAAARQAFMCERTKTCQAMKALKSAVRQHPVSEAIPAVRSTVTHAQKGTTQVSRSFSDSSRPRDRVTMRKDYEIHVGTVECQLHQSKFVDTVSQLNEHESFEAADYGASPCSTDFTAPQYHSDSWSSDLVKLRGLDPIDPSHCESDEGKAVEIMDDHDLASHQSPLCCELQTEVPGKLPKVLAKVTETELTLCRRPIHPFVPNAEASWLCDGSDQEHIYSTDGFAAQQENCALDAGTIVEATAYNKHLPQTESCPQCVVTPVIIDSVASPLGSSLVLEDSFTDSTGRGCTFRPEECTIGGTEVFVPCYPLADGLLGSAPNEGRRTALQRAPIHLLPDAQHHNT